MKRALILLAFVGSAHAEFWDGNTLHSRLNGTQVERGIALGYVMGVYDSLVNVIHCSPNNVTAGQAVDMVKNFLEATPGVRHHSADSLVSHVLKTAWPCKSSGSGRGV